MPTNEKTYTTTYDIPAFSSIEAAQEFFKNIICFDYDKTTLGKMTNEELIDLANELHYQIEIIEPKYKKRRNQNGK